VGENSPFVAEFFGDGLSDFLPALDINVSDDDMRAFFSEFDSGGTTNAAGGTRDERDFTGKVTIRGTELELVEF
jgi:hypothetical protein